MEVVGERELRERLNVSGAVFHAWVRRGVLPPPDGRANGQAAWLWTTIETWARETGRLPGLHRELLAAIGTVAASEEPLARHLIASGHAQSAADVRNALQELAEVGLVGCKRPDHWVLRTAGRRERTRALPTVEQG